MKATDALRTGTYSKTLTFTLSHHDSVTGATPLVGWPFSAC